MRTQRLWWEYPEAAEAISTFLALANTHIGDHIVSVVLFGGLVRGEWAPKTSDIDLVVVLSRPLSDACVAASVGSFVDALESQPSQFKKWVYVYMLSREALAFPQYRGTGGPPGLRYGNLKRREFTGFPMSAFDAYDMREYGIVLAGDDVRQEFPDASPEELESMTLDSLLMGIRRASDWGLPVEPGARYDVTSTVGYVAWMCRSLFWQTHQGRLAAKGQAIDWAVDALPSEFGLFLASCLQARFEPDSLSVADESVIRDGYAAFYWYGARATLSNFGRAAPKEERPSLGTDGRYDFSEIERLAGLSAMGR